MLSGEESACHCRRHGLDPWVKKIPWRRKWLPMPVFLPGKSHGQRSLAGYSPWGHKRIRHSLMTKQQHFNHGAVFSGSLLQTQQTFLYMSLAQIDFHEHPSLPGKLKSKDPALSGHQERWALL